MLRCLPVVVSRVSPSMLSPAFFSHFRMTSFVMYITCWRFFSLCKPSKNIISPQMPVVLLIARWVAPSVLPMKCLDVHLPFSSPSIPSSTSSFLDVSDCPSSASLQRPSPAAWVPQQFPSSLFPNYCPSVLSRSPVLSSTCQTQT
jgi:hypothetical protein